jgi:hypothetical protein
MSHIFISYSHDDEDYAVKLEAAMREHGLDVWRDSLIDYGTEWPDVIEQHLDDSAAVVLVMSVNAKRSRWVKNELIRAERRNIPVLPVLLSGEAWLALEAVQYSDVRGGDTPAAEFFARLREVVGHGPAVRSSPDGAPRDIVAQGAISEEIDPAGPGTDPRAALIESIEQKLPHLRFPRNWLVGSDGVFTWSPEVTVRINRKAHIKPRYRATAHPRPGLEEPPADASAVGWYESYGGGVWSWPKETGDQPGSDSAPETAAAVADLYVACGDDPNAVAVDRYRWSALRGKHILK